MISGASPCHCRRWPLGQLSFGYQDERTSLLILCTAPLNPPPLIVTASKTKFGGSVFEDVDSSVDYLSSSLTPFIISPRIIATYLGNQQQPAHPECVVVS